MGIQLFIAPLTKREIVKLLVDNGAKVDLQNKKKGTPYRRWDWTNDEVKNYLQHFETKINFT